MPLTSKQLKAILKDLKYSLIHQRGSHQKYRCPLSSESIHIPTHKELAIGTAKNILQSIAQDNKLSIGDLLKIYKIKL